MIPLRINSVETNRPVKNTCENCFTRKRCLARSLSKDQLASLEGISKRRVLQKGELLFRQGQVFDSLFLVQSGSVKAYVVSDEGSEQITGFHFAGELLSLDGIETSMQTYSAEALETTSICEFPYQSFDALCGQIPELKSQVMKAMGRELAREKQCMMLLGRMHAEQRMANFILNTAEQMACRGDSEAGITFSMSRQDIANYLGLAVETTSRLLTRFANASLIEVDHRNLRILDTVHLNQLASGSQV